MDYCRCEEEVQHIAKDNGGKVKRMTNSKDTTPFTDEIEVNVDSDFLASEEENGLRSSNAETSTQFSETEEDIAKTTSNDGTSNFAFHVLLKTNTRRKLHF